MNSGLVGVQCGEQDPCYNLPSGPRNILISGNILISDCQKYFPSILLSICGRGLG